MKRINLLMSLCATTLLLSSCKPASNIKKVLFDYVEQGQFIEISGEALYNIAIKQEKKFAVLYSVDGCAGCKYAKEQLQGYAETKHCNLFWIDITKLGNNKKDYDFIVEATGYANDAFKFPSFEESNSLELPRMDIFAYQGVVTKTYDRFVDTLLKYTDVSPA